MKQILKLAAKKNIVDAKDEKANKAKRTKKTTDTSTSNCQKNKFKKRELKNAFTLLRRYSKFRYWCRD